MAGDGLTGKVVREGKGWEKKEKGRKGEEGKGVDEHEDETGIEKRGEEILALVRA